MVESTEEGGDLNKKKSLEEVKRALARIKNTKVTAEDGLEVEFIKQLPVVWLE